MRTVVVNLRVESYDVYIGRAPGERGIFGNPSELGKDGTREEVIRLYEIYFYQRISFDPAFLDKVLALEGKRLGCFCAPLPCHGDVIVDFLDRRRKDASHTNPEKNGGL